MLWLLLEALLCSVGALDDCITDSRPDALKRPQSLYDKALDISYNAISVKLLQDNGDAHFEQTVHDQVFTATPTVMCIDATLCPAYTSMGLMLCRRVARAGQAGPGGLPGGCCFSPGGSHGWHRPSRHPQATQR